MTLTHSTGLGAAGDDGRPVPGLAALIFDLSRGKQAVLTVVQPGLGAVLALGALPSVRVLAIGIPAALAGSFALYALNDVLDRDVDARSLAAGKDAVPDHDLDTAFVRHPLAQGVLSLRVSVVWVFSLMIAAAVGAVVLSPFALAFYVAAIVLELLYCVLRSVTHWKMVVSGVMVGCGALAGWVAVAPLRWSALGLFLFLALWEIGGRNIVNDLSDIESDAAVGIRTLPTVRGGVAAARVAAAVAVACLISTVLLPMPLSALALTLAAGVWSLLAPAVALLRTPTPEQAASYFNRASLYPVFVLLAVLVGLGLQWLR